MQDEGLITLNVVGQSSFKRAIEAMALSNLLGIVRVATEYD